MKLIVGLGNPGREYDNTWHNLGFLVIDELSDRLGGGRFRGEAESKVWNASIAGEQVMLVKPQTYMNLSGNAVAQLLSKYGAGDPANLVVVVDDAALPLGMIRVRGRGSAGGHNGLKSIIERVRSREFARMRLGIRPDHVMPDVMDYVLSRVPGRHRETVDRMVERAADAVEVIVGQGVGRAMSQFNERITDRSDGSDLPCSGERGPGLN